MTIQAAVRHPYDLPLEVEFSEAESTGLEDLTTAFARILAGEQLTLIVGLNDVTGTLNQSLTSFSEWSDDSSATSSISQCSQCSEASDDESLENLVELVEAWQIALETELEDQENRSIFDDSIELNRVRYTGRIRRRPRGESTSEAEPSADSTKPEEPTTILLDDESQEFEALQNVDDLFPQSPTRHLSHIRRHRFAGRRSSHADPSNTLSTPPFVPLLTDGDNPVAELQSKLRTVS